jgi:poly(ADP-ribose) glycohydrolase
VKADFANKYIGGGALTHGCVQEEIMFANHPELFTSVIFCEVMDKAESLFFDGYRKYSKNTGYGWTTKYSGQENIDFSKKEYVIAIDAVHFPKNNTFVQF